MKKKIIIVISICVIVLIIIMLVVSILNSNKKLKVYKTKLEMDAAILTDRNEFPKNFVKNEYKFYNSIAGSASSVREAQEVIAKEYDLAEASDDYILPILDDGTVFGFKYGWNGKDSTSVDDYLEKMLVINSNYADFDGNRPIKFNTKDMKKIKEILDLRYYVNSNYGYAKFIDSNIVKDGLGYEYSISYIEYVYGDWGLRDTLHEYVDTYKIDVDGNVNRFKQEILSYETDAVGFRNNLIEEGEEDPDNIRVYEEKTAQSVKEKVDNLTDAEVKMYADNRTSFRFPDDFVDNEIIQCFDIYDKSVSSEREARNAIKKDYISYSYEDIQEIDFAYNVITKSNYESNGTTEILVYKKDYFDIEKKAIGSKHLDSTTIRRILNAYYKNELGVTIDSGVEENDNEFVYSRFYVQKEKSVIEVKVAKTTINKKSGIVSEPTDEVIREVKIEE